MKRRLLSLLILVPVVAAAQSPDFTLSTGRAGLFEIGAAVDDVYQVVDRRRVRLVDLFLEGLFTPALEINLVGRQRVAIPRRPD
jgi:hypothetical protein